MLKGKARIGTGVYGRAEKFSVIQENYRNLSPRFCSPHEMNLTVNAVAFIS